MERVATVTLKAGIALTAVALAQTAVEMPFGFSARTAAAAEKVAVPAVLQQSDLPRSLAGRVTPAEIAQTIFSTAPSDAPAKPARPRKVFVFTMCSGYYHEAIPIVAAAFEIVGNKTGAYTTVVSDDPGMFEVDRLKQFDAVVMDNTVGGTVFLTKEEQEQLKRGDSAAKEAVETKWERLKQSFTDFVRSGKGVVGIHGAADCGQSWPEYGEMMGGYFAGHPWTREIVARIECPDNPINAVSRGRERFSVDDEIYVFRGPYSRETHRVLLSIDMEASACEYEEGRYDGDNPLVWIKRHGEGRVYYSALGHKPQIAMNPDVLRHWLAGIQYAIGDLKVDDTPGGRASAPPVPPPATIQKITAALPASAPARPPQARKLLVCTRSVADWRSQCVSTPFIAKAIEIMGAKTGAFRATLADDPEVFEADKLAAFDAVCLVNTSGGLFSSKDELCEGGRAMQQKSRTLCDNLLRFVEQGKGLVGIHAVECPRDCPEFAAMLGADPHWKPWKRGVVRVESRDSPINVVFQGRDQFEIDEPIYIYRQPYSRNRLRVLLSLDNEKSGIFDDKRGYHGREDRDHALSWVRSYGDGRVYYNAFGHNCANAWNPDVLAHWLAGIQFALGDLEADAQ